VNRLPRRLLGVLVALGGAGAAVGLGGLGGAVQQVEAGVAVPLTAVAMVLAVGLVVVALIGMLALVTALFCEREDPFRRLRQLITAVRTPNRLLDVEQLREQQRRTSR
jgi:hypothetical protein